MGNQRGQNLIALAVAFGIVEAGLVTVYRTLLDPEGTSFPLLSLPAGLLWVEQVRELATLLLLVCAARLVSPRRETSFAAFLLAFGVWDLVYYAALRLFLGWPPHLAAWDLLFLVPRPWLAPVWAPLLIALIMTVVGSLVLNYEDRRGPFQVAPLHVVAAVLGGSLCILSFVHEPAARRLEALPARYAVEYLVSGLALGVAAFAHAWRRNQRHRDSP